ncbi:MAG: hypothetical protein OEL54_04970, partial [Flavobacteriaceae bacterium]|nr:hypothetical protein [Flavobacteriaceae bacterium]
FITSNKWMRANYGKSLRKFLAEKTNPQILIDLGSNIFEGATVDSNILIFSKKACKEFSLQACDYSKAQKKEEFITYFNKNKSTLKDLSISSWIISGQIEQNIKTKVEKIGITLKEWDININYGIKTGFNEAFIIDGKKKGELITKDPKSAEIIKPVLRGRDTRKNDVQFEDLWLINVHNGYKKNDKQIERIDVEDYPVIKEHLDKYFDKLNQRSDKGVSPYNLRNCAYIEAFSKEKIIYPETTVRRSEFFLDKENYFVDKTCFFITGKNLAYISAVLSSSTMQYYLERELRLVGKITIQYSKQYMELVPIPKISKEEQTPFIEKTDLMLKLNKELREKTTEFLNFIKQKYNLEKLSKKLQKFHELEFPEFKKQLKLKNIPMEKEMDLMNLFNKKREETSLLKTEIDKQDSIIDEMVFDLYGLDDEERRIVLEG